MQILELFWLMYVTGWTFEPVWLFICWTLPLTILPFAAAQIAYWNWQDGAPLRRINRR